MRERCGGSRSGRSGLSVAVGLLLAAGAAVVVGALPAGAGSSSASVKAQESEAKHVLLVRSDFPSGWSSKGSVTTSDSNGNSANFPGGKDLISCLGLSSYLVNLATPSADSPTFQTKGGEMTVQHTVNLFPSTKVASEANAAISGPKVAGCLGTAFQGPARQSIVNAMGHGITVGTIAVTPTNPAVLIPHASGFTISFPATYQGVTIPTQVSIVSMFRGKTDSQLTLTSVLRPFPTSLARHLETVAYGRSSL